MAEAMTLPAKKKLWPTDELEDYEERAAIVEFMGGRPRVDAERIAEELVRQKYERRVAEAKVP